MSLVSNVLLGVLMLAVGASPNVLVVEAKGLQCPDRSMLVRALAGVDVSVVFVADVLVRVDARADSFLVATRSPRRTVTRTVVRRGSCDARAAMLAAAIERSAVLVKSPEPAPAKARPTLAVTRARNTTPTAPTQQAPPAMLAAPIETPAIPRTLQTPAPAVAQKTETTIPPPVNDAPVANDIHTTTELTTADPKRFALVAGGLGAIDDRGRLGFGIEGGLRVSPAADWWADFTGAWRPPRAERVGGGDVDTRELRFYAGLAFTPRAYPLRVAGGALVQTFWASGSGYDQTNDVFRLNPGSRLSASARFDLAETQIDVGASGVLFFSGQDLQVDGTTAVPPTLFEAGLFVAITQPVF